MAEPFESFDRQETEPEALEAAPLSVEEANVLNESALGRTALSLTTDASAEDKIAMAGETFLESGNRYIASQVQSLLSEERLTSLQDLHDQAFDTGQSGFEGNLRTLSQATSTMDNRLSGSMIIGKFEGAYRISPPNIDRMRKVLPDAETLARLPEGPQKQFYNEYARLLSELENLAPADVVVYNSKKARKEPSLPEKQLNYALKNFAMIGLGIVTAFFVISAIAQKKLTWTAIGSVGLFAYLTNPKLFASVPEKMKQKLAIFKNDTFDRHIPSMTEEFAQEMFDSPKSDILKFKNRLAKRKDRTGHLTDEELEDLTMLSQESQEFLQSIPPQEALDLISLLAERSGTDPASREAQEIILNAIKNKANTKKLGSEINDVITAAKAAETMPSS